MRASALPRLFRCPASDVLAQANSASVYTEAGEERHDWLSKLAMTRDASVAPAEYAEAAEEILRRLPAGETSVEVEVIGPFGVTGHYDVAIVDPARRHLTIVDWKSWESVGSAATNEQTLLYVTALGVALGGIDTATVMIVYVQPDRAPRFDIADLDVLDIADFEHRLGDLKERIAVEAAKVAAGQLPDVSEGRHCKYCPAAHVCPAKTALIHRIVSGAEVDELGLMRPLDDATARAAYERLQAAKQMLKRIESALYAHAAERPIQLGNGKVFGKHTTLGKEDLDGDVVWRVLAKSFGREVADVAVSRTATKVGIDRALKIVPDGALLGDSRAAAKRHLLEEIRIAGGSQRREVERVEEHTPLMELADGEEAA